MDDDISTMSREELLAEVRRLRAGIREHRDSSGHDLCWHHPKLWGLLPERIEPRIAVPPWPIGPEVTSSTVDFLSHQVPGVAAAHGGGNESARPVDLG